MGLRSVYDRGRPVVREGTLIKRGLLLHVFDHVYHWFPTVAPRGEQWDYLVIWDEDEVAPTEPPDDEAILTWQNQLVARAEWKRWFEWVQQRQDDLLR